MSVIDDLLAFIAAKDATFASRIRGAAAERIARFEALAGRPLPYAYKQFLSRLGDHDGGLKIGDGATTRLDAIIEYYEDIERDGDRDQMIPDDCVVIAYVGVATFDLSLDFSSKANPTVMFTSGREKKGLCSESLDNLLFSTAFWRYYVPAFRCKRAYRVAGSNVALPLVAPVIRQMGFDIAWFSDAVTLCANRADAAIIVEQALARPVVWQIFSHDQVVMDQLELSLKKTVGLVEVH
jgi:hypothetical protein